MENSYKSILDKFQRLENECNVNQLTCLDIAVWPVVRMVLWQQMVHIEKKIIETRQNQNVIFTTPKASSPKWDINSSNLPKKVDCLFFSRPQDHADIFANKTYDRHLDPLIQFVDKNYSWAKIELGENDSVTKLPRYYSPYFAMHPALHSIDQETVLKIENWREFCAKAETFLNLELPETFFLHKIFQILLYNNFYQQILAEITPRAVFQVCWYSETGMALNLACTKLGIPSVDVQHGKQGKYHGMYTHWCRIPEHGYSLLPKFFWMWGNDSKKNIERWYSQSGLNPTVVVGGNRWLGNWKCGQNPPIDEELSRFFQILNRFEKVILVTLQPLDEPLIPVLIEAMKESPTNWFWLCRVHPLQKDRIPEFSYALRNRGIQNFDMEISSICPLYELLKNVSHHVTGFSSVCYEALHFNVPTSIIHPIGAETYQKEINKRVFNYSQTAMELNQNISQKNNDVVLKDTYIETDEKYSLEALKKIIGLEPFQCKRDSQKKALSIKINENFDLKLPTTFTTSLFTVNRENILNKVFKIIENVREYGIALIPQFLNPELIKILKDEINYAFNQEANAPYLYGRSLRLGSAHNLSQTYKAVSQIFNDPIMHVLANLYYDEPYSLNSEVFVTHETKSGSELARNAYLHFDRYHSFKFMFYLLDCNERSGALRCVPGSHIIGKHFRNKAWTEESDYHEVKNRIILDHPELGIGMDQTVAVQAPAGSLIVFDTDMFHLGGIIEPGKERLVLRGHCRTNFQQNMMTEIGRSLNERS